jgi:alpha-N-arabinofuranosidase
MSLDVLHPLSEALPTVMQIDIPKDAKGEVGFKNYGADYLRKKVLKYANSN